MRTTIWVSLCLLVPTTVWARGFDLEPHLRIKPSAWTGIVDIKLKTGMFFTISGGNVKQAGGPAVLELGRTGAAAALALEKPLRHRFGADLVALREERQRIEARCHCDVPDLASWISLDLRGFPLPVAKLIMRELNELEVVEKVQARSIVRPAGDLSPSTASFVSMQGHLEAAPGGIDVLGVRSRAGSRGEGIKVGDVENGWQLDHEDLPACTKVKFDTTPYWGTDHGTAVLGEIFALENGYGVTGIAPQAQCYVASHYDGQNLGWPDDAAAAIAALTDLFSPGDVIVIEIHVPGPNSPDPSDPSDPQKGFVPAEFEDPTFDAIAAATAKGIVVVSAAGNGGENLDASVYARKFDRTFRDSKAIMVGAGAPATGTGGAPHARLSYSDYGARVDVQGWGYDVTTLAYGDLFFPGGDVRQMYTAQFSGTSSATPIVSGAVAVVQGIRKAAGLAPMTGPQLAELFIRTGTPQAAPTAKHIGPLPNLAAAIAGMYVCGNSNLEPGETCDDGNQVSGDGCSADCSSNESCNNGVVDTAAGEVCEDGNVASGDGCSADCKSTEKCGNLYVDVNEKCDDGNEVDGDGCSATCLSNEQCGNGFIDLGEACDDGNTASGDGCSSDCQSDERCGNGIQDVHEECDDGDNDSGDGCASICKLEKRCSDGQQRVTCPGANNPAKPQGTTPSPSEAGADSTSSTKSGCNAVPGTDLWLLLAAVALSVARKRTAR